MTEKKTLTAALVQHGKNPGKYFDNRGTGLFLLIRENSGKQWIQRIRYNGKQRDIGLGSPPFISLSEARELAFNNKRAIKENRDPIAEKQAEKQKHTLTFEALTHERYKQIKGGFKNIKHSRQWITTMESYVFPEIGNMDISTISATDVHRLLMKNDLWQSKAETARRIRQRIGDVFNYAMGLGYRTNNPAEIIKATLPRQITKKKHHKSMPYDQVQGFIAKMNKRDSYPVTKLAFEWLILTATRSTETRKATWKEIEGEKWCIPEERMKMDKPHTVPLSDRCLEILHELRLYSKGQDDDYLFPSPQGHNKPISDMTFTKILRDMNINAVPHGFRSSFRTWAQEQTNVPNDIAEACLAHANPNKIEANYARSDLLKKRSVLMQTWSDYLHK